MSTLFSDAMRAAVFCNASGAAYPSYPPLSRSDRYPDLCPEELDLDEDAIYCRLKRGHRGRYHRQTLGDQEVMWRTKD